MSRIRLESPTENKFPPITSPVRIIVENTTAHRTNLHSQKTAFLRSRIIRSLIRRFRMRSQFASSAQHQLITVDKTRTSGSQWNGLFDWPPACGPGGSGTACAAGDEVLPCPCPASSTHRDGIGGMALITDPRGSDLCICAAWLMTRCIGPRGGVTLASTCLKAGARIISGNLNGTAGRRGILHITDRQRKIECVRAKRD